MRNMTERFTDSRYLATEQYQSSANLDARIQLHQRFSLNPRPWMLWVFDQLALSESAEILEVGCGTGLLWMENASRVPHGLHITISDVSPGMVADAGRALAHLRIRPHLLTADAQSLPFGSERFDAVIANHMLYHVADRPHALSELRRVLKVGGRLFATTNGSNHMRELAELLTRVLGPGYSAPVAPHRAQEDPFDLEHGGSELGRSFREVELRRYEDGLAITEADALLAYVRSMHIADLDADPARLEGLRRQIEVEMALSGGVLRISKETGLFVGLK
jgi:ubiquinone/menaquinone biosynthesis C-methylase UbiE